MTPAGVVTTLAGKAGVFDFVDGTGSAARFGYPTGVAVDGSGNVYVADAENNAIRKITAAGVVSTLAGGSYGSANGTGTAAKFNYPNGVALDANLNVYVADSQNHTIRKVTPAGVVTTLAGLAGSSGSTDGTGTSARFNFPESLTVDSNGNVFVADGNNNAIRKVTPAGVVTTFAGAPGSYGNADGYGNEAKFSRPTGIWADSSDNLYVADGGNHTIRIISPGRYVTTMAGSANSPGSTDDAGTSAQFDQPHGIAVGSSDNVFVADQGNQTIREISSTALVTTVAGLAPSAGSTDDTGAAARFSRPEGITIDTSGNLYVADSANHAIRKVTSAGVVTTLAGGSFGSDDGTGTAAQFNRPTALAISSDGIIYVADSYGTIRRVNPLGEVTTFAGTPGNNGSNDGTGGAAQFSYPSGVVIDSLGNLFVADPNNHTIRKITPARVVTTFAGAAETEGFVNATGGAARFSYPQGLAIDANDNLYVADGNNAVRKITPAGVVTTLAGGSYGIADGTGTSAQFGYFDGLAVDGSGNVFVTDTFSHTIRKVTSGGVVTTVGGLARMAGAADGVGNAARFVQPHDIAVASTGLLYVVDARNNRISKGTYTAPVGPAEIAVFEGSPPVGNERFDNTGFFTFPLTVASATGVTQTFTIRNIGDSALVITGITFDGTNASDFSVISAPATPINGPSGSSTFIVRFRPLTPGAKTAALHIANNDANEASFDIILKGTGLALPAAPVLVSPGTKTAPTGAALTTLTPTFTWKASTGATGYRLTVVNVGTTNLDFDQDLIGTAVSYSVPGGILQQAGRYYWYVRAFNTGGSGPPSAPFYFNVAADTPLPIAPIITAPGSTTIPGKLITTLVPVFTWSAIVGAAAHEIAIFDDISNASVYKSDTLGPARTFVPASGVLHEGRAYRWSVRARNSTGWGAWSLSWHFQTSSTTVAPLPPSTLTPGTSASPGTLLTTLTPTLKWSSVAGAIGYKIYVRDTQGLGTVVNVHNSSATPEFAVPASTLLPGRIYWWNVRTVTAAGDSTFSTRRYIQTAPAYAPPVITEIRPGTIVGSDAVQLVRIVGTDFRTGVQVLASYTGKTDTLIAAANVLRLSETLIVLKLVTKKTADTWSFKVKNSDAQQSNAMSLQVTAPPSDTLPAPVATPVGGVMRTQPVFVSLSHLTAPTAPIYYTLDGVTQPDRWATQYSAPILLGAKTPVTLKAIAIDGVHNLATTLSTTYTFNLPVLPVPGTGIVGDIAAGASHFVKFTIPANLGTLTLEATMDGTPDAELYLAFGTTRLPQPSDYDRGVTSSTVVGISTVKTISIATPLSGTAYLLIKAGTNPLRVSSLRATTATTVGAWLAPVITPPTGQHYDDVTVTINHEAGSTVYYTLDNTAPSYPHFVWSSSRAYTGPFTLPASATVRAIAIGGYRKSSPEAKVSYTVSANARKLAFTDRTYTTPNGSARYQDGGIDVPIFWSPTETLEQPFFFDVAADPSPTIASPTAEFPVALELERLSDHGGNVYVYLKDTGVGPATPSDISVGKLNFREGGVATRYVLGSGIGTAAQPSLGVLLKPGRRYYGLIRIEGVRPVASALGASHWTPSTRLQLGVTLHYGKFVSSTTSVQPAVSNTWLITHGRASSAGAPTFVSMAGALEAARTSGNTDRIGQVLRLDWSTMSKPEAGALPSWFGDMFSLDETIFVTGLGRRARDVLKSFGVEKDKLSLVGHSWGSYVSYEIAKSTGTLAPVGKVNRLIALDPATTGIGGYTDSRVNFSAYATRSWSIVASWGFFGREDYAFTAKESFRLDLGVPLTPNDHYAFHTAPVELFTHFIKLNYEPGYGTLGDHLISPNFSIERLDGQPSATFKPDSYFGGLVSFGAKFEAVVGSDIDSTGLDESEPLSLHYVDKATGNTVTVP